MIPPLSELVVPDAVWMSLVGLFGAGTFFLRKRAVARPKNREDGLQEVRQTLEELHTRIESIRPAPCSWGEGKVPGQAEMLIENAVLRIREKRS